MREMFDNFFMHVFLKLSARWFGYVMIYAPGAPEDEDSHVLAVHFARDEVTMERSIDKYLHPEPERAA